MSRFIKWLYGGREMTVVPSKKKDPEHAPLVDPLPSPNDVSVAVAMWAMAKHEVNGGAVGLMSSEPFGELAKGSQSALIRLAQSARVALAVPPAAAGGSDAVAEAGWAVLRTQALCHLCRARVALWLPVSVKEGNGHLYCDEHRPEERCTAIANAGLYRALDEALRAADAAREERVANQATARPPVLLPGGARCEPGEKPGAEKDAPHHERGPSA